MTKRATVPKNPKPDNSICISASKLAEMYEHSWRWARDLLLEWHAEQEKGGPIRVFRRGKKELYTTIAVLQQWMPPTRDQVLVRKIKELEKDMDNLAHRVNFLTTDMRELQQVTHIRPSGR